MSANPTPWSVRLRGEGTHEAQRAEVRDHAGVVVAQASSIELARRIAYAVNVEADAAALVAAERERAAILGPRPAPPLVEYPVADLAVEQPTERTAPLTGEDVPNFEYVPAGGDRFVADGMTLLEYGKALAMCASPERAFMLAAWLNGAERAGWRSTDRRDMRAVIHPADVPGAPVTGPVIPGARPLPDRGWQVVWAISAETEIRVAWEGPASPLTVAVSSIGSDQRRGMTRAVATPDLVAAFGARLRAFADFEDWDGRAPRCSAHGDPRCLSCSRTLPGGDDGSGGCVQCEVFGLYGMHWDTCPFRDSSSPTSLTVMPGGVSPDGRPPSASGPTPL